MDLSKLSDDDLRAISAGDMSKVSDAGLRTLSGEQPKAQEGGWAEGAKEYAKDPIGNTVRTVGDLGRGIYQGFKNVTDAAVQMGAHAVGSDRFDQPIRDQRKQYEEATKGRIFAPVGELAGNIAATAALPGGAAASAGGRIAQAAGMGAGVGALTPVYEGDFLSEKAKQAGIGALAGGLTGGASEGLARMLRPKTPDNVRMLLDEGVKLTPGQMLGGAAQRAEQAFGSVPFLGDMVKQGERRSMESLNTAAYNRALKPIGESAEGMPVGREGIKAVQQKLGDAYDTLLPKLNVQFDQQFAGDMQQIAQAVQILPPTQQQQFAALLKQEFSKFNKATASPGVIMKNVDSRFAEFARKFEGNNDGNNRMLAEAVDGVREAMRGVVNRSNAGSPLAGELDAINRGYANFVRAQRAAGAMGSNEGVFSGPQLANAIRGTDTSARKGAFAKGDALMQDLGDAAKSVMGSKVPDSGTPYRSMLALLLSGGGAGAVNPALGAAVGGGMAAYTEPGRKIAQLLLTERPKSAQELARLLQASTPVLGAGGGALALPQP